VRIIVMSICDDVKAGRVQDAATAFTKFRESH
jgi:hypothetical protein